MNTTILSPVSIQTPRVDPPAVAKLQSVREPAERRIELDGEPKTPSPKKNRGPGLKRAGMVALMVFAGLGVAKFGHDWWTVGRFIESTDDAYVGGDITVIAPKVPGFISQLSVGDNQPVHAGDLLIKLDDRDYRAALAKADAAVAMQEAVLVNLDAMRHLQDAVVAQAQAEISGVEAETTRAHDDQYRYKKLLESGAVSSQNSQQADTSYKQSLAAGKKTQAVLEAAQRQLEVIAAQKQQAQAALNQVLADRDLARLNLGYTELRAPFDGVIGNRSAQSGAYATTGSQLISLVPSRGLWIDANFKESQLSLVHPGSPATIEVDSISGKILHGHVASVAPATGAQFSVLPPENATGNFTKIVQRVSVRIVLDDETSTLGQLRPGLSVTAKVNGKASL